MASFFSSLFKSLTTTVATVVNNVAASISEPIINAVGAQNGTDTEKLVAGYGIADGVLDAVQSSVTPALSFVNSVTKSVGVDIQNSLQAASDTAHGLIEGVGHGVLNTVVGAIALDQAATTPMEKLDVGYFIGGNVLNTVESAIDPVLSLVDTISKEAGLDISGPLTAASETAHDLIDGIGNGVLNTVVGAIALTKQADTPAEKLCAGLYIAEGVLDVVDAAINPITALIDSISTRAGHDMSDDLKTGSDFAHSLVNGGHTIVETVIGSIAAGLELNDLFEQQLAVV